MLAIAPCPQPCNPLNFLLSTSAHPEKHYPRRPPTRLATAMSANPHPLTHAPLTHTPRTFLTNRERAIDYLNTLQRVYVVDAFVNWDPSSRIKVRVITCRAYHALFMHNMLIRPTREELADFGEPGEHTRV